MWKNKRNVNTNTKTDTAKPKRAPIWQKVLLTTFLGFGITVGSVYAQNLENQIPTVYHVYVDGSHIGTVNDRDVVKSYIENRIDKAEDRFDNLSLIVGEKVSYIPEKMFRPSYNNKRVLDSLKEELSIKVDATKVEINGELIGYAENQKAADEAIDQIKRQYVSKTVLDKVEHPNYDKKVLDLELGDTTIVDVSLSEKVSFKNEKVKPEEVLTTKQLVQLLKKGTLTDKIHTVKSGDVLGKVASNYNLSTQELLKLNPKMSDDALLHVGQKVNVTAYKPYLDVLVTEEKREEQEVDYKVEVKESDKMYKGEKKIEQKGKKGSKEMHYKIIKKNGEVVKKELLTEKTKKEPVNEIVVKGTKVIPSRGTGSFRWPAVGGVITSKQGWRWGSYHKGIDIAGVSNRSIVAADNGVVKSAGWDGGYGKKVVINHNNGYKTIYAHLASIKVKPGQTVRKGQSIGTMGTTGHSTGVHLHFEVYKNGSLQNPLSFIKR